jgi:hypothetical protein
MYLIFKNNRPAGNKKYANYEAARQAVRKLLRKITTVRLHNQPVMLFCSAGYTIRKVA